MISTFTDLARPGPAPLWRRSLRMAVRTWLQMRCRMPDYVPPTPDELVTIEAALRNQGVPLHDLWVDPDAFRAFQVRFPFPPNYASGPDSSVLVEKLLEHYLAHALLNPESLERQPYVDIAACASPWAKLLRQESVDAWAIDLAPDPAYLHLPYYQVQDATQMQFADRSIGSASLQCAFEMFEGEDDTGLVRELGRVLRPGGRAAILPLYMHTHACHYSTPEWALRDIEVEPGSRTYVRRDTWGIRCSRKYSAASLGARVLEPARDAGLDASIIVLRNANDIDPSVYLHFVLMLEKPMQSPEAP